MEQHSTVDEYLGIVVDYSRDKLIPEQGLALLTGDGFYKKPHEVSPQQGLARAATCFCFGDYEFAQRIYDYTSKGHFVLSGPPLTNSLEVGWPQFSTEEFEEASEWLENNVDPEGMPISCFLQNITDTREGLVESRKETAWLSMMGGGIGIHMGNRSPDEKSTGALAHLRGYDADALSYKQTKARRGSIAAYMDIDHPEIQSFLQMRNPVGGDQNKKCLNLNNAVNITDDFMEKVILNQDYELIDPKHGKTGRFLKAKEVFEEIMELRYETGEPYIMFKDTVNKNLPEWITHPLYNVSQSNLCVAPETLILTDKGQEVISELEGQTVNVWNGEEYSSTVVSKTGVNQKLITVKTLEGKTLECTPYHKFYVTDFEEDVDLEKKAGELVEGDCLIGFYLQDGYYYFGDIISSVEDEGRVSDTYCFTESKRGMGMFNGILTGQCSEITLRTSSTRTAVCCLSSLNLEKYDEWKDSNIVQDLTRFLDNVLEYFIRLAPPELERAVNSASKERAIGIGTLGWHSYLQSKSIPFESGGFNSAIQETHKIFSHIKSEAIKGSKLLASERGESYDCLGSGMRNSHLLAIAPNANSSARVGTSPSIEPWSSNAFNAKGRSGSYLIKNKFLEDVLRKYDKNTKEVWKNIILNEGSVQHLDFLSEHEKLVFKTSTEINPMWVIELAAARADKICQSQSVNIAVPKGISLQQMVDIHIQAWLKGVKTLYYCRAKPSNRANLNFDTDTDCLGCEG